MSVFVLEIGFEELPSRFLAGLEKDIAEKFSAALGEQNLSYESLSVDSTPRRAALTIHGLPETQPEIEEVVSGPPVRIAYDADGNPTKAAEGFAKTQGVALADAFTLDNGKGEYLAVRKKIGGASTVDLLAEMCPAIIGVLPFPKKMKWGTQEFTFARPLRWFLALFNETIVPFTLAEIASGNQSYGHRVHGHGPHVIGHASEYAAMIKAQGGVVLSAAERRSTVVDGGNALAKQVGGTVIWKESLLDEVQGLSEHPVPCLGEFDSSFLEVPRQALLTCMESHQKSFGVEDAEGNLLPYFLTVSNIASKDMAVVKKGWERVLRARLEDARFFWNTDLSSDFDTWLAELDKVIFLAPLGSMGNKTRRLSSLCGFLADEAALEKKIDAERAGRLSKADLVSGMVGEFDSLQGIMGGIYARKRGESDTVATAIAEQYLPAGPDSPVPSSLLGGLLSISDKADTLAGCFGLGMIPTGAADPYALRRCCLGIARIILEKHLRISVADLFRKAQAAYGDEISWKVTPAESLEKVQEFFVLRLKNYFLSQGYETLLVDAALSAGSDDVWATAQRLKALDAFSKSEEFEQAVLTFKRAANIIRKQGNEAGVLLTGKYNTALFENEAETAFASALEEMAPRFEEQWKDEQFDALFGILGELRPAVDAFFDGVMVMAEDEALRANRLNMLKSLVDKLGRLADFSALQM